MKRVVSLLVVVIITNLPISCGLRGCGGDIAEYSIITNLGSEIGSRINNGYNDVQSSSFDSASIIITVEAVEYIDNVSSTQPFFSLISASYACSPVPARPYQMLQSLDITSNTDVFSNGEVYEAGSILNELFQVFNYSNTGIAIHEFLQGQDDEWERFGFSGDYLIFSLIEKPDAKISQSFQLAFGFDDGAVFDVETTLFTVE